MPVPDSLTAWRDHVNTLIEEPVRLGPSQLAALTPAEKAEYDDRRAAYLWGDLVLETKHTQALRGQARLAVARNRAKSVASRRGIAISGAAGAGKTTAVLALGAIHERGERKRRRQHPDRPYEASNLAPVVYATVPPGATPKMLMRSFAHWLGLAPTIPARADAQQITEQIVAVLKDLGTSMVIVDEVHNLRTNRSAGAEAATALKMFSDRLPAVFLYAGIDLLASDLFAGDMGRQIKARMCVYDMAPYPHSTAAQRDEWRSLLLAVEENLCLARHAPGDLDQEDRYLWERTGGSIGALRTLLADAAWAAIENGSEKVTRRTLQGIVLDQASIEHQTAVTTSASSAKMPVRASA